MICWKRGHISQEKLRRILYHAETRFVTEGQIQGLSQALDILVRLEKKYPNSDFRILKSQLISQIELTKSYIALHKSLEELEGEIIKSFNLDDKSLAKIYEKREVQK